MENEVSMDFWLGDDFSHLKEQSLKTQLEAIFGEFQAEQYLNPSIQDKRMQNIPANISTKVGPIGALDLWESLRLQSKEKQSEMGYENNRRRTVVVKPKTSTLKKVTAYTHRLHLMHKVAQLNEVHSKRLIKKVDLPQITGNWNGTEKENEDLCVEKKNDITLPEIKSGSLASGINRKPLQALQGQSSISNSKVKQDVMIDNKSRIISFLTEKDATFSGEFRERMMKSRGIDASVGIANASHSYQYARHVRSKTAQNEYENNNFKNERSASAKIGANVANTWEPLSLNAVVECANALSQRKKTTWYPIAAL